MLSVNTNIPSLNAQRSLLSNSQRAAVSMERLTSGTRINSAKDDAAGMGVATRFNSQISGMRQATRNASDTVSMLQVAEGGLRSVESNLQRIRELAVQAASDNVTDYDRGYINAEVSQLVAEINRIADTTRHNDKTLLDGTFASSGLTVQVGANNTANDRLEITIADFNTTEMGLNVTGTGTVSTTAVTGYDAGLAVSVNGRAPISINAADTTNIFDGSASYAAALAAELNALEGVTAAANTVTSVNMGTMTLTGTGDTNDSATLTINGESIAFGQNDLQGLTAAKAKTVIDTYISSNSPAALANVTVSATGGSGNDLVITDSTGKQLSAAWDITDSFTPSGPSSLTGGSLDNAVPTSVAAGTFDAGTLTAVTGIPASTDTLTFTYEYTPEGGSATIGTVTLNSCDMVKTGDDFAAALQTALRAEGGSLGTITVANNAGNIEITTNGTSSLTGGRFSSPTPPPSNSLNLGQWVPIAGTPSSTDTLDVYFWYEHPGIPKLMATVTLNSSDMVKTGDDFAAALQTALRARFSAPAFAIRSITVSASGGSGSDFIFTIPDPDERIFHRHYLGRDRVLVPPGTGGTGVNDGGALNDSFRLTGQTLTDGGTLASVGNDFSGSAQADIVAITDLGQISVTLDAGTKLEFTNASNSGLGNSSGTIDSGATLSSINVATQANAQTAIDAVDNALNDINVGRAEIGASQSRFESVITNLDRGVLSTMAGRSRVLDADFAIESAELAKHQILQQASISVLAQANSRPEMVLALLRDL